MSMWKFWSQHISFILVGIIVVPSIRGLLITLTKFFYAISSSKSSNIIVLALAQIMGMYFVSSVLLIRMNMPAEIQVHHYGGPGRPSVQLLPPLV
uniref:Putative golgi ph regulator a n=1 Tax=Ixodes ricinus TaxID=34613 RepID=A0A0K8RDP4_IXORI